MVASSYQLSAAAVSLLFLASILPVSAIGVLWYGWAVERQTFWLVPILGLYLFGFGWMSTRVY